MLVLSVLSVLAVSGLFSFTTPSASLLLIGAALGLGALAWFEATKWLLGRLAGWRAGDVSSHVPRGGIHLGEFSWMSVQAQGHRDEGGEDHRSQGEKDRSDEAGQERMKVGVHGGVSRLGGNALSLGSRH